MCWTSQTADVGSSFPCCRRPQGTNTGTLAESNGAAASADTASSISTAFMDFTTVSRPRRRIRNQQAEAPGRPHKPTYRVPTVLTDHMEG